MKRIIITIMLLLTLTGCSRLRQALSTEVLNLNTVAQYEFNIVDEIYSEMTIRIESQDDIRQINDFLGQTVTITHSDTPCDCHYLNSVTFFMANGETRYFGIEKKSDDSFDFSNYSLSVISFNDKNYDDLMNLIKRLGGDLSDTSASTGLTVEEALAAYDLWFDNRDDDPTPLNKQPVEIYEFEGRDYYRFAAEEPSMYWYNILVNTQTGELLFMMTPDGEDPVATIQTLEDWCENGFNQETAVEVQYP